MAMEYIKKKAMQLAEDVIEAERQAEHHKQLKAKCLELFGIED
jgi:hypothetical protein